MLKVIVAEDDSLTSYLLKNALESFEDLELIKVVKNGSDLVQSTKELNPDVLFVDIEMPNMTGIQAVREIFNINPNVYVIFVTAHSNYALEAFDLYAFDYIVKPFTLIRIKKTISRIQMLKKKNEDINKKVLNVIQGMNKDSKLIVRSNGNDIVINIADIIYITRVDRKVVIVTSQSNIKISECLEKIEEKLNESFFRCHKGYIVNLKEVKEIAPLGKKTYVVKFLHIEDTALTTQGKVKLLKEKLCI